MASTTGTNIAQGDSEYAMRAIVRVTATPPAAAKRWFCPNRSAKLAWPTSPREIATTAGPRTPPVMPCNTSARAYAEDKSDILGSPLPGREIGGGNGSEGVCIPAKKKFSQLKASRLCCDGAAG